MSWIARKGRVFASVCHWPQTMRSKLGILLATMTLSMGLGLTTGCTTQATAPPPVKTSPAPTAATDEIVAMLRFANRIRDLPTAERKALTRQWEHRLSIGSAPGHAPLHMALLLGTPGDRAPVDFTRARELLDAYLGDATGKPEVLLDFARYQLSLLDEREHWIKAARQERRARLELKQKLEALKAIERRMTDQGGTDKVPIR